MPHSHIRVITVFRSLRDESPTPRDLDKQEAVPVLQIGPVASSVKLPRLGTFGAGGFYTPMQHTTIDNFFAMHHNKAHDFLNMTLSSVCKVALWIRR